MNQTVGRAAFAVVVLVATTLRVMYWPARYEVRDVDEVGYLSSSLCLVEGLPPGYKPSPAGPLIWIGWAWGEAQIVREFVHPYPRAKAAPAGVRVFMAADRAVAELYRDLSRMRQVVIGFNLALSVLGVAAGFGFGYRFGNVAGGVVVGGLLAVCPMLVDYADQSRPYAFAWSFAMISLFFATCGGSADTRRRLWFWATAVAMGLAIGSRIEMLLMLPMLWWTWTRRLGAWKRLTAEIAGLTIAAGFTAYAVAPWLVTGLPGNLRAIATIQVANPRVAELPALKRVLDTLIEFSYTNGLGPIAVLTTIGLFFYIVLSTDRHPVVRALLTLMVLLLTATIFKSTGFGLHHSGPAVLTLIAGAGIVAGTPWPWRARWTSVAIGVVLLLPLVMSVRMVKSQWGVRPMPVADWVESHVPAGTTVYTHHYLLKEPLPTAEAADRIWAEVTALDAGRRKFASGLKRFGMSADQTPRVWSDENLVQERGNERRFYVLGTDAGITGPRYDLRMIRPSPVFGVQDVAAKFARTGGVVLWRTELDGDPPASLGPVVTRLEADGGVVLVFCSPGLNDSVKK